MANHLEHQITFNPQWVINTEYMSFKGSTGQFKMQVFAKIVNS